MKKFCLFIISLVFATANAKATEKSYVKSTDRNYENDLFVRTYTDLKNYFAKTRETRKYNGLEGWNLSIGYTATNANYSENKFAVQGGELPGTDYITYAANMRETDYRLDNFYIGLLYAININNYIIAPEVNKYLGYSAGAFDDYTNFKINFGLDLTNKSTLLIGIGANRSKTMLLKSNSIGDDFDYHFLIEPTYIYRFNANYSLRLSLKVETGYEYDFVNSANRFQPVRYDMTSFSVGFMYRF